MEINLNCDLGEKSIHFDGRHDVELLKIINSANIACGYHAGSNSIINETIKLAKNNDVSIGAHPGFKDMENFGRKNIYLSETELTDLVWKQLEIINELAKINNTNITHVKPHGALYNMACENIEIAISVGKAIKKFNNELIYVILPLSEMENAAKKIDIKFACEIFADRNYEDNGQLVSRDKSYALINNPIIASQNIIKMLNESCIISLSGKRIKCNIDTICIHGDGLNSVPIAKEIQNALKNGNFKVLNLNNMTKFK
jgi:UPF0271 protein